VDIPIIGAGGISTVQDAIEFLLAGARGVQVGTATFREPRALAQVVAGLGDYMAGERIESLSELVGWCHGERNVVGS
jgi:dihydroorotate dehydrogenase (NAD+) catalytic subunit